MTDFRAGAEKYRMGLENFVPEDKCSRIMETCQKDMRAFRMNEPPLAKLGTVEHQNNNYYNRL